MNWNKLTAIVLVVAFLSVSSARLQNLQSFDHFLEISTESFQRIDSCPCDNRLLCMPLEEAKRTDTSASHVREYIKKSGGKEVFAFVLKCDVKVWSKFDWTKLTTIAIAGFYDADLVCHAHRHGVKVVKLGNFQTSDLPNPAARLNWAKLQASDVALKFIDGINIDYEDAIADGSLEQKGLTNLVKETSDVFHEVMPGSQVSFDVAWKAGGIDNRYYDYKGIGNYSDLIFIMAYDEQSQIFDKPCTARPNSGIYKAALGIQSYLDLGIPAEKMILGVPWYGYNYPCISVLSNGTCLIKEVPFRGANCSDAAGKEYPFSYIMSVKQKYHASYHWDKNTLTPYYTIKETRQGPSHQMRFDDARSLVYKYALAQETNVHIGVFTINYLDYSDTSSATEQQKLMFGLIPPGY